MTFKYLATLCLLTAALRTPALAATPQPAMSPEDTGLPQRVQAILAHAKKGDHLRLFIHKSAKPAGAATAAYGVGWNFENVANCIGLQVNGIDYVQFTFWSYDQAITSDPMMIAAAGSICVDSPYLALHITVPDGEYSVWDSVFIPHK